MNMKYLKDTDNMHGDTIITESQDKVSYDKPNGNMNQLDDDNM